MHQNLNTDPDDNPSPADKIAQALWPHLHAHPQASDDGLDLLAIRDDMGEGNT